MGNWPVKAPLGRINKVQWEAGRLNLYELIVLKYLLLMTDTKVYTKTSVATRSLKIFFLTGSDIQLESTPILVHHLFKPFNVTELLFSCSLLFGGEKLKM